MTFLIGHWLVKHIMTMLISHYAEDGTPIMISQKDVFIEDVWKQLALEQPGVELDKFDMAAFMKHIHTAFGEAKVLQDVLQATLDANVVSSIQLSPDAAAIIKRKISRKVNAKEIVNSLTVEATRLKEAINELHETMERDVIPLARAGWRLQMKQDGWHVDVGAEQLQLPIQANAPPSVPVKILDQKLIDERTLECSKVLFINGYTLKGPQPNSTGETLFLRKQIAEISAILFRQLLHAAEAEKSKSIFFQRMRPNEFIIRREPDSTPITVSLSDPTKVVGSINLDSSNPMETMNLDSSDLMERLLYTFISAPFHLESHESLLSVIFQ